MDGTVIIIAIGLNNESMLDHVSLRDEFFPDRIGRSWLVILSDSQLCPLIDQSNPFLANVQGGSLGTYVLPRDEASS